MSDLFGIGISEDWTSQVIDRLRRSSHRNRYYLLTKQPQNLSRWSPFPDNCWIGVTATDTAMFVNAMDSFLHVKAKVKFLSLEPLLDWDIESYILEKDFTAQQLDGIIIGAQTKPYKPPKLEWVQKIIEACHEASIPVFLKNNLFIAYSRSELNPKQEIPKA